MIGFYLTGFGLGALISAYAVLYFYTLLKLKKRGFRILWGCLHCGVIISFLFLTNYVLNIHYPENKGYSSRLIFLLLWLVPYGLSVLLGLIWLLRRHGKHHGKEPKGSDVNIHQD